MWILLSLAATAATSAQFIFSKKSLEHQNEYVAITALLAVAVVIAGLYALISGIHIQNNAFFLWLGIRILIDSVAIVTNYRAFKFEEVSYVIPIISLLPVLSAASSFLINQEIPSQNSLVGIAMVVVGVGVLFNANINWQNFNANKNVLKATGYILITILIWAFAEAIHKKAIGYASPSTYFFLSYVGFFVIFAAISLRFYKKQLFQIFSPKVRKVNILNGLSMGLDRVFSLNAITTGLVAYVGAIKSSSTAFTSILAWFFLKEEITKQEAIGIAISTLGVVTIAVFG